VIWSGRYARLPEAVHGTASIFRDRLMIQPLETSRARPAASKVAWRRVIDECLVARLAEADLYLLGALA